MKVLFRFAKIRSGLQDLKESTCSEASRDSMKDSVHNNTCAAGESGDMFNQNDNQFTQNINQTRCPDEKLGFIMCECGLEGISLKVSKFYMIISYYASLQVGE